jgi:hypothetical protein
MARVSLKDLCNNIHDGLTGGGRQYIIWLFLVSVYGVTLNHESNIIYFIFRSVKCVNTVNMNTPPLV